HRGAVDEQAEVLVARAAAAGAGDRHRALAGGLDRSTARDADAHVVRARPAAAAADGEGAVDRAHRRAAADEVDAVAGVRAGTAGGALEGDVAAESGRHRDTAEDYHTGLELPRAVAGAGNAHAAAARGLHHAAALH